MSENMEVFLLELHPWLSHTSPSIHLLIPEICLEHMLSIVLTWLLLALVLTFRIILDFSTTAVKSD